MEIDSELRSKETWLISEDGLWDISFGIIFLGWGLTILLRHPLWIISSIMMAYFFVVMAGKEVITRPRMEYFSIGDDRLIKLSKWIRLFLAVIICALVIGALMFWVIDIGSSINWLSDKGISPLFLIFSVFLLIFGYLSQNGYRYYLYAGISLTGLIIIDYINYSSLTMVFTGAMLFSVIGIGLLIRFIIRYPKPKVQENGPY
jgi:hypothetical protein